MAKKTLVVGILLLAAFLLAFGQYTHQGYVSVVGNGNSVRLLEHGLHIRPPWQRVTSYPIRAREVRLEITDDGPEAKIHFDAVLFLSVNRDSIASLHRAYNGAYIARVVSPMLTRFLREYGEGYGLWDEDTGPQKVTSAVLDFLGREAGRYGINVTHMWLLSFDVERKPQGIEPL
jgi:hypothetical protein